MNRSNTELSNLTREYIKTAMLELLASSSYERISITDLVRRAGVSRTAFYRNYSSKDALMDEMFEELMGAYYYTAADKLLKYTEENMTVFFRNIKDHQKSILLIVKAGVENISLLNHQERLGAEFIKTSTSISYMDAAVTGAANGVVSKWILSGMKEDEHEMAHTLYTILHMSK